MIPALGDVWQADVGAETRRLVAVLSDRRFHDLAERVMVAPVIDSPDARYPWIVELDSNRSVALQHLRSVNVDRLLRVEERLDPVLVQSIQRVLRQLFAL